MCEQGQKHVFWDTAAIFLWLGGCLAIAINSNSKAYQSFSHTSHILLSRSLPVRLNVVIKYFTISYLDSRFSPVKPNVPQDSVNQHSPCINAYKMSPVIPISSPSTVTNSWSMTSPMQSVSDMHSFGMVPHNIPSSSYIAGFQPDMAAYQTPTGNMALRNRVRN